MSQHDAFFRTFGHRLKDSRLSAANATFANPSWERGTFHLLILRLSSFSDVARSTPHLFLAREVRAELPDALIDMAFLPSAADAAALSAHKVPMIVGTQSHRSLGEFDLVFVSNSYLLELANLPVLFKGSAIPLWASERGKEWPPIVLGGSNASAAHAIAREDGDCMADAIFFGEGEGRVAWIARLSAGLSAVPKSERMARIAAEVPGLWPAGDLSRKVPRAVADVREGGRQGLPFPVLPGEEAGTARLSITMGCPSMCSFCFEGHDRKPFREVPLEALLQSARELKLVTGAETLELESYNFNTHSQLPELLEGLHGMYLRVNSMSQRADILARTPGLLALELASDKRSYTLGVEGISARQRRFLHKGLSEADVRRALTALHDARVREVKLFYLLTGCESDDDFDELSRFLLWLKDLRRAADSAPRMVFSFGLLVRMPFTPLRYDGVVLDEQAWRLLIGRARSACETNGFEFRLAAQWDEYVATQSLASGGYHAHELLEGRPVDDWIEAHPADILRAEKRLDHPFAFSFLEDGESRDSLHRQYERARAGRDDPHAREANAPDRTPVPPANIARLSELMRRKHRLKPVHVTVAVPREAAGYGPEWLDAWLVRRLLQLKPGQLENVLSIQEVLLGPWIGAPDIPWFGRSVVAVTAWDTAAALDALEDTGAEPMQELAGGAPASFSSIEVRLELPSAFFPEAGMRLASFLNERHVPVTVQRSGVARAYIVGEKALRKKSLTSGRFTGDSAATVFDLRVGHKFPLAGFLASFAEPNASRRALLEVTAIEMAPSPRSDQ